MSLTLRKAHGHLLSKIPESKPITETPVSTSLAGPTYPGSVVSPGAGYSFSTISPFTEESPLTLSANTYTQLVLPEINFDELRGGFEGHQFSQAGKFQPRAPHDTQILRLALLGKSDLTNNTAVIELRNVDFVIDMAELSFHPSAGTISRMSCKFLSFSGTNFIQNGGTFWIKTQADAEVWDIRPLVVPISPQ